VFSTNVAESSLTIEGVTAVIDSGLARVASHSPWSGLPRLEVRRVSKASAEQRAGRAGRTAPGRVVRLYPLDDFVRRPEQDVPEILREDLSGASLMLRACGVAPEELDWLDPPPAEAWQAAERLLLRLGAVDPAGALTEIGQMMARLPLEPRLARLVVEAERRGAGDQGCALAALLSAGERMSEATAQSGPSDLLWLLEQPWSSRTRRLYEQIRREAKVRSSDSAADEALLMAILVAFPGPRSATQARPRALAFGRRRRDSFRRQRGSRRRVPGGRGRRRAPRARLAARTAGQRHPARVAARSLSGPPARGRPGWSGTAKAERVERSSDRLLYDELVIHESSPVRQRGEEAEKLLAERALGGRPGAGSPDAERDRVVPGPPRVRLRRMRGSARAGRSKTWPPRWPPLCRGLSELRASWRRRRAEAVCCGRSRRAWAPKRRATAAGAGRARAPAAAERRWQVPGQLRARPGALDRGQAPGILRRAQKRRGIADGKVALVTLHLLGAQPPPGANHDGSGGILGAGCIRPCAAS
jgi:hypothetical protein